MVATRSSRSYRRSVNGGAAMVVRRSGYPAGKLDELAADELEHPPIDRLVRPSGLLDDELREELREVGIAGAKRTGQEEMPLGQPDQHAARRAQLAGEMLADLGQQDTGGIPAVAGVR
jgi:hypothetical protein